MFALATLTAAFNRELPKPTIRIYLSELEDLDDGILAATAVELVRLNKFFPTVAEIRERAIAIDPSAVMPPRLEKAWGEVLDAACQLGRDSRPSWSHPAIGEALLALGPHAYRRVCDSTHIASERAAFAGAYNPLRDEVHRSLMLMRGGGDAKLEAPNLAIGPSRNGGSGGDGSD